jgi:hypothetical protein
MPNRTAVMKRLPDDFEELPRPDLEYRRLRLFSIDMDGVRHGLRLLRRYRRDDIRFVLIRDVVITYARPFVGSKSPNGGKYFLATRFVPPAYQRLHDKLLDVRNTLFAHTDLTTHRPQLLRSVGAPRRVLGMSFTNADYHGFLRQVDDIGKLADGVDTTLNAELRRLELILR